MLIGAVMVTTISAQVLKQNEAALVYYSPKTEITLDFVYTVEVQTAGQFAEYAEELLGIHDFVAESSTIYALQNVHIGTSTKADVSRAHKVSADAGIPMLLSINDKGILKGYNIPYEAPQASKKHDMPKKDNGNKPIVVPPFMEDILKATDSANSAETVAQQIYHLRETRMFLLSGEVEHAPADGESMKHVLDELDKQEKALVELFTGKRIQRTEHRVITIVPNTEDELLYFSAENGFTDSDNIDADTIRVSFALHAQEWVAEDEAEVNSKSKKKGSTTPELSPIVYNLPGSADVKVVYGARTLGSRTLPVAQLGIDVPLPKSLFTGNELPIIVFNEKTGNIVSISK